MPSACCRERPARIGGVDEIQNRLWRLVRIWNGKRQTTFAGVEAAEREI